MAGDVDDVVDAPEDAVVTVRSEHGAVGGVVWPVPPILAVRVGVVFLVVVVDEALRVAPDRLHDAGPRIANTNISGGASSGQNFLAVFVPNHWIDAEACGSRAPRLHRVESRLGGAQESAGFGLPPGVDDHGFPFADDLVIPAPDFRLNRFADGGHMLEAVSVLLGLVHPCLAQHADSGR